MNKTFILHRVYVQNWQGGNVIIKDDVVIRKSIRINYVILSYCYVWGRCFYLHVFNKSTMCRATNLGLENAIKIRLKDKLLQGNKILVIILPLIHSPTIQWEK